MADRVGEIVKVVWEDVASWEGVWIYPSEAIEHKDFLVTTYGKIIYEDEHRIIVASEEHPDGKRYANVTRIPKVLIRSIQELEEKK